MTVDPRAYAYQPDGPVAPAGATADEVHHRYGHPGPRCRFIVQMLNPSVVPGSPSVLRLHRRIDR